RALVRRERGVALNEADPVEGDGELFGDELHLGRLQTLTELAFAGARRHDSVGANRDPGVELRGGGARSLRRRRLRGGRRESASGTEAHQQHASGALQKVAPRTTFKSQGLSSRLEHNAFTPPAWHIA